MKSLSLSVIMISCGLIMLGLFYYFSKSKIAYIDTVYVYDNFKGKIDMEKDFDKKKASLRAPLDSIETIVKQNRLLNKTGSEVVRIERTYQFLYNDVNEKEAALRDSYMEQIWKQLNQYLKEYGEKRGYDYILGDNGNGSLYYAKSRHNISEEILKFVNQKYEGK